jgi:hypothetical protein
MLMHDNIGKAAVGEGSTQMRPKNAEDVQVWVVETALVELGREGGEVIVCDCVVVVLTSLQPHKKPGVWHSADVGEDAECDVVVES